MKEFVAKVIVAALDKHGDEHRLYTGYSGWGMYGKATFGVVVPNIAYLIRGVVEAAMQMAKDNHDESNDPSEFIREISKIRQGGLGRDIIVY